MIPRKLITNGSELPGIGSPGGGSVIEEFARLDKIVRDCEASILIAERLKARGRWRVEWDSELSGLRDKLTSALRDRDWLDAELSRMCAGVKAA